MVRQSPRNIVTNERTLGVRRAERGFFPRARVGLNSGHADSALTILGRMAGIDEATLEHLIEAGQTVTILSKFDR